MALHLKTLRASDGASLPAPVFDTAAAQVVSVAADTEASVALTAGLYYLVSRDSNFAFTHGTGDLSGNVRLPWFRDVYLQLVLDADETLVLSMPPGETGDVVIVPAREHG